MGASRWRAGASAVAVGGQLNAFKFSKIVNELRALVPRESHPELDEWVRRHVRVAAVSRRMSEHELLHSGGKIKDFEEERMRHQLGHVVTKDLPVTWAPVSSLRNGMHFDEMTAYDEEAELRIYVLR
jgi:hypothetical protein